MCACACMCECQFELYPSNLRVHSHTADLNLFKCNLSTLGTFFMYIVFLAEGLDILLCWQPSHE